MGEILSEYLPNECLQGEDVPYHLIWEDMDWDLLSLELSGCIEIKEIFNVSNEAIVSGKNSLEIRATEVPGYIGIVFRTKQASSTRETVTVHLKIAKGSTTLHESTSSILLCRPEISILEIPDGIEIVGDKVSKKIGIERGGYGTVFLYVEPRKENEVTIDLASEIKEALEQFNNDFKYELGILKEKYPHHSDILASLIEFDPRTKEEAIRPLQDFEERIRYDEEFLDGLGNAFLYAYLKNSRIESLLVEPMLNFLESVVGDKVIMPDIFSEVYLKKNRENLHISVKALNLLGQELGTLEIPPIPLEGRIGSHIKLLKLFEFQEG